LLCHLVNGQWCLPGLWRQYQVDALIAAAQAAGVSLFAAWHSRFAAAMAPAQSWLTGKKVLRAAINWKEDIRHWHPGQDWILAPGGMGVFDPAINALSMVTALLPPFHVSAVSDIADAQLDFVAATYGLLHPSRSRTVSLDSSCHGTLVTITPGVKSRRDLSRSADWLCRSCSHQ
jgi:predicted dehydrogenase